VEVIAVEAAATVSVPAQRCTRPPARAPPPRLCTRISAAIIMPATNSEVMSQHLAEISTQVSPGRTCGGWSATVHWHQRGKRLHVPDNITLLPLPAYSPELNPMENIWDYLRGNKLSSRLWDSYDAIVAVEKHGTF
jgi:hypothetical protein